jgi:MFS family permease
MEEAFSLGSVVRDHPEMRAYLVANALWEASLGALKTFVFLFITVGLGHSQAASAGIVGGVALLILPAAVISGKLADRYGRLRAMVWVCPSTASASSSRPSPTRSRSSSRSCSSWGSAAAW